MDVEEGEPEPGFCTTPSAWVLSQPVNRAAISYERHFPCIRQQWGIRTEGCAQLIWRLGTDAFPGIRIFSFIENILGSPLVRHIPWKCITCIIPENIPSMQWCALGIYRSTLSLWCRINSESSNISTFIHWALLCQRRGTKGPTPLYGPS